MRILHAIHDFLPRHRAGSEIYAATLCRELSSRHHVTVVCADYDPARPHGHLTWRLHEHLPVIEIANNWVCSDFSDTYRSTVMSEKLDQVLQMVQPHVVHLHNLLNLSFELPGAARARGIPVVATLHDYTLVCASGGQRIHRSESHVCRVIDTARCARCFVESPFHAQAALGNATEAVAASTLLQRGVGLARKLSPRLVQAAARSMGNLSRFAVTAGDMAQRMDKAREVFGQVQLFVAPSRSIADEFVALGLDPSRVRVSNYGFVPMQRPSRRQPEGRLRIGFVGTLVWHKGIHVLIDAVRRLPDSAYELRIYGDTNVFPDYVAELRQRARGLPVQFLGGFDEDGKTRAYADLDVLVVPSLWLENSPLVIHEAFQAGLPVIGSRIGGTVDLITDGRNGRLYDPVLPDELSAMLESLIDTPEQLAQWEANIPAVKSIADDARDWERIYAEVA